MGSTGYLEKQFIERDEPYLIPTETNRDRFSPPGKIIVSTYTGAHFRNEGDERCNLYTDHWSNRYSLEERFAKRPMLVAARTVSAAFSQTELQRAIQSNDHFRISGTNATEANVALAVGGGCTFTTGSTSGDQMIISPLPTIAAAPQSAWTVASPKTQDCPIFEAVIRTGAAVTQYQLLAGLKITDANIAVGTDADGAYFFVTGAAAAGTLNYVTRIASVTASVASVTVSRGTPATTVFNPTLVANTNYVLRIAVGPDRIPSFFVNGWLVGRGSALTNNVSLIPVIGLQATSAAARAVTVRGIRLSKLLND